MTLSEVLPSVRQLSTVEKLKLIRILAEDLEAAEDISPLEPFKTYDLPTPYNSFGAGVVLMQALELSDPCSSLSLTIAGCGRSLSSSTPLG
nr:hypothetical protein [Leptolyngbya sp. CCY15150]